MPNPTTSFVYDRRSALKALRQGDPERLMPALLASIPPKREWEGTLVFHGPSPLEQSSGGDLPSTVCVGVEGAAADELQRLLVEAAERLEIRVLELYEGGPEQRTPIVQAVGGRWVAPPSATD
jgi:hypothetical protein